MDIVAAMALQPISSLGLLYAVPPSSHRFLGFSIHILQLTVCCRTFFGTRCSSILNSCPAHCSRLKSINSVIFMYLYLYKPQVSALYLILHLFSYYVEPKIRLKIFLSYTSDISSALFEWILYL